MDKIRVLVVEDNLIAMQASKIVLSQLNCMIDSTTNGEDAIEMAQKNPYEVILMDIGLPGINGVEACEAIRQYEKTTGQNQVPIVAVTANADPEQHKRCINAGMQSVVVKPLNHEKAQYILSFCL